MRERYEDFKQRNAEILALAPDTVENARSYFERNEIAFPCLPDPERSVFRQYDVKSSMVSLGQRPGQFVVDKDGIVRYAYLGWQQWEIPSVEETLAQIDSVQTPPLPRAGPGNYCYQPPRPLQKEEPMDAMLPRNFELPWTAPRVAVLEIAGQIGVQVRGPEMVRAIKGLTEDSRVRAVIVEVDSPGGSAPVSDAIHRAIGRLAKRKPTVAFVQSAGLSGGYLIACAAQKIIAVPTALVGSIGVIFVRPVVQELMEKLGIRMVVTHEGKLKGMFQPWREPTPEEQEKVRQLTDEYYNWFVDAVAKARAMPAETVRGYATGEMFSAAKAKEMGKAPRRLQYVRPRRPLLERLLARSGGGLSEEFIARLEERLLPRIEFR
ncbi:MAG: signal peptide peptidase SppA [Chloroflexi bacterium]|nr:MAG: signal peptide peptidase SppA [Chloroflexota bacterium]